MYQTQQNIQPILLRGLVLFFLSSLNVFANNNFDAKPWNHSNGDVNESLKIANVLYDLGKHNEAISEYKNLLESNYPDSTFIYKRLAFSYSKSKNSEEAVIFIDKYIKNTLDVSFVDHSYFEPIRQEPDFRKLQRRYQRNINGWALFCLYVGFIGVFISTILVFRPVEDRKANFLMGCFLLLHSFFILRITIFITNYEFYLPHALYVSASFSFLYGPLIYFYFKRIYDQYIFRKIDLLHLLPTVLFLVMMMPIYTLSGTEKLRMIINNERPFALMIMITKLLSLTVYGVLLVLKYNKPVSKSFRQSEINWQRNLILFYSLYTLFYAIYVFVFRRYEIGSLLFNFQIFIMTFLVLYISYNTFFNLALARGRRGSVEKEDLKSNQNQGFKYSSSSLTSKLSLELKDKLMYLLDEEKVYRDNDITLQKLANLLNTNRHNTSQVINEHFGLNFFDLINSYRISEAMNILKNDRSKGINIIDVAYEVGFNNKVTFNKSFKKYNQVTPSEYLRNYSV